LKPKLKVSKFIYNKGEEGLIFIRNSTKRKIINLRINITVVDKFGNCIKLDYKPLDLLALKGLNNSNFTQKLTDNYTITIYSFNNILNSLDDKAIELTILFNDSLSNTYQITNRTYKTELITSDKNVYESNIE
jgi:hypothetical protein